MRDKLNITIKLASLPPISLEGVTPAEEATMREAEYNFNRLWRTWCTEFSEKSPEEVLAMVAFQFARLYYDSVREMKTVEQTLEHFNASLDNIVLRIDEPERRGGADSARRPSGQE